MTDYRNLTTKDTGTACTDVYEDGHLVARLVPHDRGSGWKIVDLKGSALTTQPYDTAKLALQYLPTGLLKRRDETDD